MPPKDPNAPVRHPILWEDPNFYDEQALDEETRRIFDICHGCRRCFNLCESFPRLFDLIDDSQTGELESVESDAFKPVVEACTLCDMCFINKCPYVPPHEFNLDFPHLMLRHRAVDAKKRGIPFIQKQLVNIDRNATIASKISPLVNAVTDEKNTVGRALISAVTPLHPKAFLPRFQEKSFIETVKKNPENHYVVNEKAPAYGEKVVLYVTCYGNYHQSSIAHAALSLLTHNGVLTEVVYPGCCGMPLLEQGDLPNVAKRATSISKDLHSRIQDGYTIISLVPSCTLMLKQEWPLLLPHNHDVQQVAKHTFDISDYLTQLFRTKGMAEGLAPLSKNITLHLACHSRAQNRGAKAAELLRMIPGTRVDVIERCSGHGGSWGVMKDNFEIALKIGKPVVKQVLKNQHSFVASECPLAGEHIRQGLSFMLNDTEATRDSDSAKDTAPSFMHAHPLEIFACAFGLISSPWCCESTE